MRKRPAVHIVVPFAGDAASLDELLGRVATIDLGSDDSVTVVDNRPDGSSPSTSTVGAARIVRATRMQSSYYARNAGAADAQAEWLLFIDADVEPPRDLADRYFTEQPGERTAVLAGAVLDEPLDDGRHPAAARFAAAHASMSQSNTLLSGPWAYAQTANCAVRRKAFEDAAGFREELRSGGDADLCFRLRHAGWKIEPRDEAVVVHRSRRTLRKLLRQRARHGSGAAWLESEYPGFSPRQNLLGLAKWTVVSFARAGAALVRGRNERALMGIVEPMYMWAFELGRMAPNRARGRG